MKNLAHYMQRIVGSGGRFRAAFCHEKGQAFATEANDSKMPVLDQQLGDSMRPDKGVMATWSSTAGPSRETLRMTRLSVDGLTQHTAEGGCATKPFELRRTVLVPSAFLTRPFPSFNLVCCPNACSPDRSPTQERPHACIQI